MQLRCESGTRIFKRTSHYLVHCWRAPTVLSALSIVLNRTSGPPSMAQSLILQGFLGAIVAVLGAVLWKLVPYLLAPFQSSILNLPGPPSSGWFLGNISDMHESDSELVTDEWIEKYGPYIAYRGYLNVSRRLLFFTRPFLNER